MDVLYNGINTLSFVLKMMATKFVSYLLAKMQIMELFFDMILATPLQVDYQKHFELEKRNLMRGVNRQEFGEII
jgi:hypothetical protein